MATLSDQRESSPGGELLNALSPSRILPNHVIAVRRWRRLNEKNINNKIRRNIRDKRAVVVESRDLNFKRSKKIPLDVLTKDWLKNIGGTDELRVYLIENCLPSLVLGLESLLEEVGKNKEKEKDNFNPLNYLAQHLMRNNPRYNRHIENSPYMKGLNEVRNELRQLVAKLRHTKSAKITSEARKRRYQRQTQEALEPAEMDRRADIVAKSFQLWSFGDETIPLYKTQRALRSFMEEKVPKFNEEMREVCKYIQPVPVEDRKDAISCQQYTRYIMDRTEGWPIGAFGALIQHIEACAKAVPVGDQRQRLQFALTSLFRSIDKEQENQLCRAHILALIKEFYGSIPINMKKYITNPLDWSDKDTVYSPTPTPSIMTSRYCPSGSITIETPKTLATPAVMEETVEVEEQPPSKESAPVEEPAFEVEVEAEVEVKVEVEIEPPSPDKAVKLPPEEDAAPTSPTSGSGNTSPKPSNTSPKPSNTSPTPDNTSPTPDETSPTPGNTSPTPVEIEVEKAESIIETEPSVHSVNSDANAHRDSLAPENGESPVRSILSLHSKADSDDSFIPVAQSNNSVEKEEKVEIEDTSISLFYAWILKLKDEEAKELRLDIDFIGEERPSALSQPREQEIDMRINLEEFIYVTERLLGEDPHPRALTALSEFLEDSFQETPQQRQSRQLEEKLAAKHQAMQIKINDLFDDWDVDKLGFLDKTEILHVLSQWQKNSTKPYNIEMSKQICKSVEEAEKKDLLRDDFMWLCQTFHKVLDSDDYMDRLLDFVHLVVQTQRADLRRERKRRRWLEVMELLPRISGSDHSVYFRSFFDIIEKDFAYHGNGRLINAYIALIEVDPDADEEDEDKTLLRYVAATGNDQNILMGRTLYATQKCISNQVRRSGKAVYISQIRNNNQVHLWAMDRWAVDEDRDGAFLVLPLKNDQEKVVGVVGVDTLLSSIPTQFLPHEITFIQNVVKQLSKGFSFLDARHKFSRTLISLLETIPRKESAVIAVSCYVVEPVPQVPSGPLSPDSPPEFVLRHVMSLNPKTGIVEIMSGINRETIRRSDSTFRYSEENGPGPGHANVDGKRDYLFACLDKREEVQNRAYGTDHLAMCIEDQDGLPIFIMDIDTGSDKSKILKQPQIKSVRNLLDKMVVVFHQLLEETASDEKKFESDWEENLPDDLRFALRFEKKVLEDLKRRMSSMDGGALSEIKSYKEPPAVIGTVIQVVMLMLNICPEEELQEWNKIKIHLNSDLLKRLAAFDPLSKDIKVDIHKVNDRVKGLTATEVKKGGSLPTYLLYQWVIDVISIIRVGETTR